MNIIGRILHVSPRFFILSLISSIGLGSQPAWSQQAYPLREVSKAGIAAHCVLDREDEHIIVRKDGRYLDLDEVFLTILDEKGKRAQQVQHFYINKNYSRLKILKMEVIKPGGRSILVDLEKNSSLTAPSSLARMNIYDPNLKVMNVFVPELSPGDTIHYIVETDNFKPMIHGHFFGRSMIQQSYPVKNIRLEIDMPKGLPLHYMIKDRPKGAEVKFDKGISKGMVRYRWIFNDVPEIVPEPYMPDIQTVAMRLLFSTLSSWKDVSVWYYHLVEPKLKVNQAIKEKVSALIKGKVAEREKLNALFFFVARKIRYLGIIEEANRPGFEPHDVSLTFSRRYGVCRDKAALLVAMLRQAGFSAAPVIMSAGTKLDPEIPVPYFNHAIAAVLDDSGHPRIYMDPTSETSRQFLPDYEQDSSCLPAIAGGSDLLTTPVKPPDSNLFTMDIKESLVKGGLLRGRLLAKASGFADTAFRGILMRKSRDEQERFLRVFLLRRQPRLKIEEISWTDPADDSKSFSFHCKFELPDALKKSGLFFPFSACSPLGPMDSWLLGKASMTSRSYPLKIGYSFKSVVRESIDFHIPYAKVRLPDTEDIDNRFLLYKTGFSLLAHGVAIERVLAIKKLEFPTKRYHDLLRVQAALEAAPFCFMLLK